MENLIPRWYRELELFRGVKPLLVLEGCVMDQVRVPVTGSRQTWFWTDYTV